MVIISVTFTDERVVIMPGFVTHYIFGIEAYHNLKSNTKKETYTLKKIISANRSVFSLGLQGPDLFFYYLPSYILEGHNLGAIAHTTRTGIFFEGLLKGTLSFHDPYDRAIAESYLCGFIGHYTLDTICHPYIYGMTHYDKTDRAYFSRHAYLETDIDTALLHKKLHRTPCSFHAADTLALSAHQKKVVARLLYFAYRYTYPELRIYKNTMRLAIFSLQLGLCLLHDDSGKKKALVRLTERYCLGYPLFSPLFPSDTLFFRTDPFNLQRKSWQNPWDHSIISNETFFELYDKAMPLYLSRLNALSPLLHVAPDDPHYRELFETCLKEYGNLSFHSGLDSTIPS